MVDYTGGTDYTTLNDPYATGLDNGSLSGSSDSPTFNLAGFDSGAGGGTATNADPNALGFTGTGPNYYNGTSLPWQSGTGSAPSPANGWSGSTSPQGGNSLQTFLGSLGRIFGGGPATPATPATPGAAGSLGLTNAQGQLSTTGLLAIGGAVLLAAVLFLRR